MDTNLLLNAQVPGDKKTGYQFFIKCSRLFSALLMLCLVAGITTQSKANAVIYSGPYVYHKNKAIEPITPTIESGSGANNFRVANTSPDHFPLPAGLSVNNATGVISGTPTATTPSGDPANGTYYIAYDTPDGPEDTPVEIDVLPNSDIASITTSTGLIQPHNFNTWTLDYQLYVFAENRSVLFTPVAVDPLAVITVNDKVVSSGSPSVKILIPALETPVTVKAVTTEAGRESTTIYNYSVRRGPVVPGRLFDLTTTAGALSPVFENSVFEYSASTADGTMTVTPSADEEAATIQVKVNDGEYSTVVNRNPSAALPLTIGENIVKVLVTSTEQEVANTYTLTVTRHDADLQHLVVLGHSLSAKFNTAKTGYTVNTELPSIQIRATADGNTASITINGEPATSGVLTDELPLVVGSNLFDIVVSTDGGGTKTYKLKVIRGSYESRISTVEFSPTAALEVLPATTTLNFKTSVAAGTANIKLKPTPRDKNATVMVNGSPVAVGSYSPLIPLVGETTDISMVITSENGLSVSNYTITIYRAGSNNAEMKSIALNKISTVVKAGTTYSTSVDWATTAVTVKPTAVDKNATIRVNGTIVASGSNSGAITFSANPTIVGITITAQDGITVKNYSLAISRNGSNNAELKSVVLSPAVTVTETSNVAYSATVNASTVRVKPSPESGSATITVNGSLLISSYSAPVSLNEGPNQILIVVTAQDGVSQKTYTLTVTRPSMSRFSNHALNEDEQTPETEVTVNTALSPNGDGVNDLLNIAGIEGYPDNTLRIMNSKGVEVITISGYDNQTKVFDGRNQSGALQPAGTYFYLLEYSAGKETKTKSGYIVLKY